MHHECINISRLCCIGGLCESFIFADIFQKRYKSPTDTMTAKNFKSLLDLFNGNLFDAVLNDKIIETKFNQFRSGYPSDEEFLKTHDDFSIRSYCNTNNGWSWYSGHIDFTLKNRKEEFKRRIDNFNNFTELVTLSKKDIETLEHLENNYNYNEFANNYDKIFKAVEGNYYLYSISPFDFKLTKNDLEYTINNLPNYVIDNLIILGTNRYPMLDIFKQFKNISINLSLGSKSNKWLKIN